MCRKNEILSKNSILYYLGVHDIIEIFPRIQILEISKILGNFQVFEQIFDHKFDFVSGEHHLKGVFSHLSSINVSTFDFVSFFFILPFFYSFKMHFLTFF